MSHSDKINFYYRAKQEYKNSAKPFVYELDLVSPKPKPKAAKFTIIIKKFLDIFKNRMKSQYTNEEDHQNNYWKHLEERYRKDHEMRYINDYFYEKSHLKLQKFFAILLHTKRIFFVMSDILHQMSFLYSSENQKKEEFEKQIKNIDFLQDGQYKIIGLLISKYDAQAQKMRQEDYLKQKQELQKKNKEILLQKVSELIVQFFEKVQNEYRKRISEERKEEEEQKMKNENLKKQLYKEEQNEEKLITPNDFPVIYIPTNEDQRKKSFSKHDLEIPLKNKKQRKVKHSQKLFNERFKDELETFSYNLKPQISEDKSKCHKCGKDLKTGFYVFGGNQNICEYTGYWYCNDDIAQERVSIPWKAIQNFDLRGYTVSKQSYAQIKSYFDKAIIQVRKDNPIIKESQRLYDFLVLKRQIHLIYDSICNLDLIEPLMKNKLNYCLQMNLFSMKNLYDIYNGQQTFSLSRDFQILSRHFYRCEICQKRKGYICPKCKDPVKIFPFELRETHGCQICKKLYHRKCLFNGQCLCSKQ